LKTELDLALEAIVRNNAIPEAYEVAAEHGWYELFPGVIYQDDGETKQMESATARQIIKQAKKDETYAGPEPEDDATCIKEAEQLVEMAEQAWAQYIRGPEVEIILTLAYGPGGWEDAPKNGDAPAASAAAEPEQAEPTAAADDDEQAGPQDLSDVPENLKTVEPWQDYNQDTVAQITEGVNFYVEEGGDELSDLLGHIWAFESTHKNRVKVIKHVKAAWEQVRAAQAPAEAPAAEPESAPTPEPEPEPAAAEPAPEPEPEKPKPAAKPKAAAKPAEPSPVEDGDDNVAYKALRAGVERELAAERVQIPKPPTVEMADLPWEWREISNEDLHNFHMQYAALAYYKSYVQSREERIAMHCKEAADELRNKLLVESPKYDEKNKEIKVTVLEAQIESDDNVKAWRKRQRKHEAFALQAKRETESYYKLVEALSRLESMRHQAWERGRK
jgi:hypothetical protein